MSRARRRDLRMTSLDDVMPEVDRLLAGHETTGNWSLGQICNHLSAMLVCSVDGYERTLPWIFRATAGQFMKRRLLASGTMPSGIPTARAYTPKPGLDARAEAEALRAAVNAFKAHTGAHAIHPFFGTLTPGEWNTLHAIHCAHHLGFARPVPAQVSA